MNIFRKPPSIDFLGQRRFWITVSIVLTGLTIIWPIAGEAVKNTGLASVIRRPNWGVDFAGGNEIQVQFNGDINDKKLRETVEAAGLPDPNIQQYGDPKDHEFLIRIGRASLFTTEEFHANIEPKLRAALPNLDAANGVGYAAEEGDQVMLTAKEGSTLSPDDITKAFASVQIPTQDIRAITDGKQYSVIFRGVSNKIQQTLQKEFPDKSPAVRRVEQVGASVGKELKIAAVKSVVVAILLILLYIGFRFDFAFGTGAVVSLLHDATIVVGYYLVSGAELNNSTIAAVLTIIGYSVNDTVIIYDRIRENMQKHKGRELFRTINDSINETLSRTIITHFTVLLSLTGLVIFTVGTLREFAFSMMVGVVTGTYSSVYIASPVVMWIEDVIKSRRASNGSASSNRPGPSNRSGSERVATAHP